METGEFREALLRWLEANRENFFQFIARKATGRQGLFLEENKIIIQAGSVAGPRNKKRILLYEFPTKEEIRQAYNLNASLSFTPEDSELDEVLRGIERDIRAVADKPDFL